MEHAIFCPHFTCTIAELRKAIESYSPILAMTSIESKMITNENKSNRCSANVFVQNAKLVTDLIENGNIQVKTNKGIVAVKCMSCKVPPCPNPEKLDPFKIYVDGLPDKDLKELSIKVRNLFSKFAEIAEDTTSKNGKTINAVHLRQNNYYQTCNGYVTFKTKEDASIVNYFCSGLKFKMSDDDEDDYTIIDCKFYMRPRKSEFTKKHNNRY
jgi:hypothetical protein